MKHPSHRPAFLGIAPSALAALLALCLASGCGSPGAKSRAAAKAKAEPPRSAPQEDSKVATSTGLPYRPTAPVAYVDPPTGFRTEATPPTPLAAVPAARMEPLLLASPLRPYREPKATNDWVNAARGWRGTPFRAGGSDREGADSAGYAVQLHREVAGTTLPATPAEMWSTGQPVGIAAFEPGDLVFFGDLNSLAPIHVGVYVGERSFTHSSHGTGVSFASLDDSYWKPRFLGARRAKR